jgi:serine beta-lactamase-like protein LACTB
MTTDAQRSKLHVVAAALIACSLSVHLHAAEVPAQARVHAYLENLWRTKGTPAISIAIAVGGKLVFSEGAGDADLENLVPATGASVYNIGSVSKVMTAVAIMQLVESGKVSLDDPIQKYVPSFPQKDAPITIRHIMTHSSGIRHYLSTDFPGTEDGENMKRYTSLDEALKIFKDDPLLFPPGRYYSYSSYAVNLLQGVVEKASGVAFEDYMRQSVWSRAGMLSSSFDVPDRIVPHRARGYYVTDGKPRNNPYGDLTYKFASGGMISSAEDLVRFGVALNHGSLLSAKTIALMYAPVPPLQRYNGKEPPDALEFSQALMWRVFKDSHGRTFVNHCGTVQGYNACLVNYPSEDVVVAIMGNGYPLNPARNEAVALADMFLP